MKNIMKRAWELKKEYKNALFSECLKEAWKEYKKNGVEEMKTYIIANWFYEKNFTGYDLFIAGNPRENAKKYDATCCDYSRAFTEDDIIKETEKAYFINVRPEVDTAEETHKQEWIPKSLVKEVKDLYSFEYYKNFEKNSFNRIEIKSCIDVYRLMQVANIKKAENEYCYLAYNKNDNKDIIKLEFTYAIERVTKIYID